MVELTDGEIKLTPIIAKPREAKAKNRTSPKSPRSRPRNRSPVRARAKAKPAK